MSDYRYREDSADEPRLTEDGWVQVAYHGDPLASVSLAVVTDEPTDEDWRPAYHDRDDRGDRVVEVRPPGGTLAGTWLWQRVNGLVTRKGRIRR